MGIKQTALSAAAVLPQLLPQSYIAIGLFGRPIVVVVLIPRIKVADVIVMIYSLDSRCLSELIYDVLEATENHYEPTPAATDCFPKESCTSPVRNDV